MSSGGEYRGAHLPVDDDFHDDCPVTELELALRPLVFEHLSSRSESNLIRATDIDHTHHVESLIEPCGFALVETRKYRPDVEDIQ